ncbi:hypothetical protein G5714_016574 [Onychostoma macrolepis]|uniref:Uncharacterized protein n=1 Tax=Onychostoma macrolepis TaxID=369639 RepID=A0A7J6C9F8_9TELE|nr:hypothetical protein G5714_016574 [Onychostoma macrolepis]
MIKRLIISESRRLVMRVKQTHRFLSTLDYSFTFRHKGMHWTKSACLIELSASMKSLAVYKVTEREGMEGSGRYGLAELVPPSGIVSLSFRAERSQAERPGFWPEGVAGCIPWFYISSTPTGPGGPAPPPPPPPPPPSPRAPALPSPLSLCEYPSNLDRSCSVIV